MYTVETVPDPLAQRQGLNLNRYYIRCPDGMLMKSLSGEIWCHTSKAAAARVCEEANRYLNTRQH